MPGVVWFERPFRVSSLRAELSETKTQPYRFENSFKKSLFCFRMPFQKYIHVLAWIRFQKKNPCPIRLSFVFFFPPCARPGQAGLRVATVLVSERGQDLVTPKLNYIIYYMNV